MVKLSQIRPTNLSFAAIVKLNLKQEWAALHIKWEEGEVHVAGHVKVHPLCIADHPVAVDPDAGGVNEVAGVPGVEK